MCYHFASKITKVTRKTHDFKGLQTRLNEQNYFEIGYQIEFS